MLVLSADSASELFTSACRAVLADGRPVAPRGVATLEILGASLCLTNPRRRLVEAPPARVINAAFAVAEAVWILSGSDDEWIYGYNGRLAECADNGRLMGAYGPRLRRWQGAVDQLALVCRTLREDPGSRRAVVQLFDPGADFRGHKDVPCTLGYRFFLRDGLLHMHTTMRSQDLWLGFCYDIFTATVIQELIAGWLGAGLGAYRLQVDSLHLYAHDRARAERLPAVAAPSPAGAPLAVPWDGFGELLSRVIANEPVRAGGWAEFAAVMTSYRAWKAGDRLTARLQAGGADGPVAEGLLRWYDRVGQAAGTQAGHGGEAR